MVQRYSNKFDGSGNAVLQNGVVVAPGVSPAPARSFSTGDNSLEAIAWRKSQGIPESVATGTKQSTAVYDATGKLTGYKRIDGVMLNADGSVQTTVDDSNGLTHIDSRYPAVSDPYDPDVLAAEKADLERQKEIKRQALIDAINSKYSYKGSLLKTQGEGELARQRALNLRSGTIDSPFGDTEINKTTKATTEALKANEDARAGEVSAAMTDLDTYFDTKKANSATDRMNQANFETTKRANTIAEMDKRKTELTAKLQILGKNGVDFEKFKLDPTYQKLKDEGYSDLELQAIMNDASPKPSNINYQVIGNYVISTYADPLTGKAVVNKQALPPEVQNPDNVSIEKLGDGSLVYFDKATQKVIKTIKSTGTGNQSQAEIISNARSVVAPQLSAVADVNTGFVTSKDYAIAKRAWVNSGLLSNDFDKAFVSFIDPAKIKDYGFDQATFNSLKSSPTFIIQQ